MLEISIEIYFSILIDRINKFNVRNCSLFNFFFNYYEFNDMNVLNIFSEIPYEIEMGGI